MVVIIMIEKKYARDKREMNWGRIILEWEVIHRLAGNA